MVDLSLKLSIHTLSPLWQNKALLMRPLNPSRMKEEQDVYDKLTTSHETKKKSSDSALCEQPRESPSRELPTKDMFSRSDKWTFARTTTVDKWDSSLSLLDH